VGADASPRGRPESEATTTGEVQPGRCVRALLAALYPTIRWETVTFHRGIPPGVRRFTRVAITLPAPLATHELRVHLAPRHWDPCSPAGLALLVHECFHVLQFQERMGGVGLGPLRAFSVQYLFRAVFEGGGKENRYEAPAYAQETAFFAACRALPRPLCDCSAADADIDAEMLERLLRLSPWLVRRSSR
jgi:hypothetical protein